MTKKTASRSKAKVAQDATKPARPAHCPTLCTRELADSFARYMQASPYIEPASAMMGISARSAFRWIERGLEELELRMAGVDPREEEDVFVYFCQTVARARATWEMSLAGEATRQARPHDKAKRKDESEYDYQGNPELALSLLKSAFPDRWGLRKLEATQEVRIKPAVAADLSSLTEEELDAYIALNEKLAGPRASRPDDDE